MKNCDQLLNNYGPFRLGLGIGRGSLHYKWNFTAGTSSLYVAFDDSTSKTDASYHLVTLVSIAHSKNVLAFSLLHFNHGALPMNQLDINLLLRNRLKKTLEILFSLIIAYSHFLISDSSLSIYF